jgi:sterol desaturase/sphingolipid hydroxylase (fatty acid hydroxylase superfamily)
MPLERAQNPRADRHSARDLGHFAANTTVGFLGAGAPLLLSWLLATSLSALGAHVLWPAQWPWLAQCALALVVADLLGYWVHRLEHGAPALWAYHVLHHDVPDLHILRGTREHFVTNLVRGVLIYGPLVSLGAPLEALFAYQTLVITQGSIAHGNLRLHFPEWCHRWLLTPPVHRLHHAADRSLSDSNFASVTPIWDRIFGTYSDPNEHPVPSIGIDGPGVPDSFLGQLAHPFRFWFGRA